MYFIFVAFDMCLHVTVFYFLHIIAVLSVLLLVLQSFLGTKV
jgi:hypothetical protein